VAKQLGQAELETLGHAVKIVVIKTDGDLKTGSLADLDGQGLFTKRLET